MYALGHGIQPCQSTGYRYDNATESLHPHAKVSIADACRLLQLWLWLLLRLLLLLLLLLLL
jgi:hypothetical protein